MNISTVRRFFSRHHPIATRGPRNHSTNEKTHRRRFRRRQRGGYISAAAFKALQRKAEDDLLLSSKNTLPWFFCRRADTQLMCPCVPMSTRERSRNAKHRNLKSTTADIARTRIWIFPSTTSHAGNLFKKNESASQTKCYKHRHWRKSRPPQTPERCSLVFQTPCQIPRMRMPALPLPPLKLASASQTTWIHRGPPPPMQPPLSCYTSRTCSARFVFSFHQGSSTRYTITHIHTRSEPSYRPQITHLPRCTVQQRTHHLRRVPASPR